MTLEMKMSRLDQERASSMADEGGVSAAIVEGKNTRYLTRPSSQKLAFEAKLKKAGLFIFSVLVVSAGVFMLNQRTRLIRE